MLRPVPLSLLLCALASPAFGQQAVPSGKAASRPAAARLLAPTKDLGCAPAAVPPEVSAEDDVALLRAVLALFHPAPEDVRVMAIEEVALLGDARGINALAQLVFDPSPAVQNAALHAIGRFSMPRAAEILANAVRHPRTSEALKLQALESLVFQRDEVTRAFLAQTSASPRYSLRVQSAAKASLAKWTPAAGTTPAATGGAQ
jgi:HEAT repeat protein